MRLIQTSDLFLPLHNELVSLLRGLDEADWSRPTVAGGWVVKDVVAHLLDTDLRRVSSMRDGYRPPSRSGNVNSYDEIVTLINHLNATWVEAAGRLSPSVLVDLLEWSGPRMASLFASLAPDDDALIAVAWAGEARSTNWMDVGREYTEKWHHQAQIRDAVGAPGLTGRRWLAPVLGLAMRALPHAFRHAEAPSGSTLGVRIEGEAGGVWHIVREGSGWELREGEVRGGDATARVRLDAETAWRLFFNALSREEAERRVEVTGDEKLWATFFDVRSVMVASRRDDESNGHQSPSDHLQAASESTANPHPPHRETDSRFIRRAIRLAHEAEGRGDLPVGAVVALDGEVIAEAGNAVLVPAYHPGRHAETEALSRVPPELWPRGREMTLYTTLEPCVMCAGALLLHGVGRVVFGALDGSGGAGELLARLPAYYEGGAGVPAWIGPVMPELCDPLFGRVRERFDVLPCGKNNFSKAQF